MLRNETFYSKLLDDVAKLSEEMGEVTYDSSHAFIDKVEALFEAESAALA